MVKSGDLLIGMDGEFRCYEWSGEDALLNQRVCRLQNFASTMLPRFVLYGINKHLAEIEAHTSFTTVKHISSKQILGIDFPVPPLPEQKRIVAILDEAFEGLAVAAANAEKNLKNARQLFDSYLGAVFAKASHHVPLSEYATDITDGDHSPPPKAPTGVPFITISNIDKQSRMIDFTDTFTVSREYFDGLQTNKRPRKGDVLYTVTGSFGIPVLVHEDRDFCFQRHIGLIRPKPSADPLWISYALLSPQVFLQAAEGSTGTAQKTVSLRVLRQLQVPKWTLEEQKSTSGKLLVFEAQSQRLESTFRVKAKQIAELKQSLLHKAFSGELTSRAAEATLEAAQ